MYIGRFAPSPSGKLHFGSLVSALASFLDARHNAGKWLVRIEDMDPPRQQVGADRAIIESLKTYKLDWDDGILYQSSNHSRYNHCLAELRQRQLLFNCDCTRARIRELKGVYDSYCRERQIASNNSAQRLRINSASGWHDLIQGHQLFDQSAMGGDFVVRRRDTLISYQIAVTVDDIEQGITRVVRGADLLNSTARQKYLMQCLGWQPPEYAHVPMATHVNGDKLSKQTAAPPLPNDSQSVLNSTIKALDFLGQCPPKHLQDDGINNLLDWAIAHWSIDAVPKQLSAIAVDGEPIV